MAEKLAARPSLEDDAGSGRQARAGQVQSVSRALSILNTIADNEAGMTLTAISVALGLAPSTTHRLLTTLQHERYVRFDNESSVWKIGVQAFVIGNVFLRSRDLVSIARPHMERLMEDAGETVSLAVTNEGRMIYLAQVESREMMRALAKPGAQVSMHCSAVGKALLAEMDDVDVAKVVKTRGLPRLTENTIDEPSRLRTELDRIRRVGFAIDDEEHAVGLRCVAAPLFDEFGHPLAAISLSGPMVRIPDNRLDILGGLISEAAEQITLALGGRLPRRLDS